jgi:hypothetical protein
MANFGDLVGAFMQSTMAPSGGNRVGSALEQLQRSGFGGMGGGRGNRLRARWTARRYP